MHVLTKDLVILVADKDMEFTVRGLLIRHRSLAIRGIDTDILRHPDHDPGCFAHCHNLLRPQIKRYRHALVMFDRHGSGREGMLREDIENSVEDRLRSNGWQNRAAAIVLDPELEAWIWSDSPHVDRIIGWRSGSPDLRSWLVNQGFVANRAAKPAHPKEAMYEALRVCRKPKSSSLYLMLAGKVGLTRCTDPAFAKLRRTLRGWFPQR